MNKITRIILFGSIALNGVQVSGVAAHDGWVEVSPAIVEKDQPATIALIQGNHSNEHKSYRIAGKWDAKYTNLLIVDPKGKSNNLTDRLIDFGEDAETIGPKGPKGYYLAPFVPRRWRAKRERFSTAMDRRSSRSGLPRPPSRHSKLRLLPRRRTSRGSIA
jgi:hypothetical protein